MITDNESLISGDGEDSQDSCSSNDLVNDSQVRSLILNRAITSGHNACRTGGCPVKDLVFL